jgi:UDP-N-acetylglucosamine--N-acetylmuramyl-(pentapeptide) pyrophosphoryl-undecaprenol N-acetylglucosamine transferase
MIAHAAGPILLAAGGTGGHMFPAEALARALIARDRRVALVTDARGGGFGERLPEIAVHRIAASGLAGTGIAGRAQGVCRLALGYLQARRILRALAPAAVVGFGGYASVPAVLAAQRSGRKSVIHEQNAVLGRANRLLARRADAIATSFERVQAMPATRARIALTGNPVRPAIAALAGRPYVAPVREGPIAILVLGGSLGARVFARVVPAAIARLGEAERRRIRLAQQCRQENLAATRAAYDALGMTVELAPFFEDVPERLAVAQLVIARAGASTVAELAAAGRPALLVPYPHATDDHQRANAAALVEASAAWTMAEPDFTPAALAGLIAGWLAEPAPLAAAAARARALGRRDAADRLADLVLATAADRPLREAAA